MVDDGYRDAAPSPAISRFISRLEAMLMEPEPRGLGLPVVTLLLEGGVSALQDVKENLAGGQPCVVVAGSGRAADLLAYGYRHATKYSFTPVH